MRRIPKAQTQLCRRSLTPNGCENKTGSGGCKQAGNFAIEEAVQTSTLHWLEHERCAAYGGFRGGWPRHFACVAGPCGDSFATVAAVGNCAADRSDVDHRHSILPAGAGNGLFCRRRQTEPDGGSQRPFFSGVGFSLPQPLGGHQECQPAGGAGSAGPAQSNSLLVDGRDGASQRPEAFHLAARQGLGPRRRFPVARSGRGRGRLFPLLATAESGTGRGAVFQRESRRGTPCLGPVRMWPRLPRLRLGWRNAVEPGHSNLGGTKTRPPMLRLLRRRRAEPLRAGRAEPRQYGENPAAGFHLEPGPHVG